MPLGFERSGGDYGGPVPEEHRTKAGRLVSSNTLWWSEQQSYPKAKLKCLHGVALDVGCERCG